MVKANRSIFPRPQDKKPREPDLTSPRAAQPGASSTGPFPCSENTAGSIPPDRKKVSPNESVLQHHSATSNPLKTCRVWDCCVTVHLCNPITYQ